MRTTLSLDPDVTQKLKSRVAEGGCTLKEVVNDALRRGLAQTANAPKRRFRVIARPLGLLPGIDPTKLNQLVDELEAGEFAAKLRRAKKRQ